MARVPLETLTICGRELLLHLNEQITKVLFPEKDVSRRLCESGTHWQTTIFTALGYHVWQNWQYSGGLIVNIELHSQSIKLQLADTDFLVEVDQSIGKKVVGQSYHKISLIGLQRFADDQRIKSLKNRRPDLIAEIACLDTLWHEYIE